MTRFPISRRDLVRRAITVAATALLAPIAAKPASARLRFARYPFMFGVASGDPTPNGFVLWTRLAADIADMEAWGLAEEAYPVYWVVHDLDRPGDFAVAGGVAVAARERGYAVNIEVENGREYRDFAGNPRRMRIEPGKRYRYRFWCGSEESAEGLTRTAPASGSAPELLRFGFCSCSEYENNFFHAYRSMAEENFDFAVHLGDYIYERCYQDFHIARGTTPVRKLAHNRIGMDGRPIMATTLGEYRQRYAEYRSDADLQEAHRVMPWIVTWDDHEVENDYAGGSPLESPPEAFAQKRVNAYRAYFENLPIRLSALPEVNGLRQLYRRFDFGNLLRLHVLDERQYRDAQACRAEPGQRKNTLIDPTQCPELLSEREMLGRDQFQWLSDGLANSTSVWNVLAQGVPFTPAIRPAADGRRPAIWHDSWTGYPWAQKNVIDLLDRNAGKNPVFITGDIHSHWVNCVRRLREDPDAVLALPTAEEAAADPRFRAIAAEFVCTAISSNLRDFKQEYKLDDIPHMVKYHDGRHHGYVAMEVRPSRLTGTMVKMVADESGPQARPRADRSDTLQVEPGSLEPRRV
jgi:alkaline phosphatase D